MAIKVQISDIVRTPELQSRADLNMEVVAQYASDMDRGAEFPAIDLYRLPDGLLYLVDGAHTTAAAESIGRTELLAEIVEGTWEQALEAAARSLDNQTHGLQRTNADKRRQTVMLMQLKEWRKKSDNTIRKFLGVSAGLVADVRFELKHIENADAINAREETTRIDAKGRTINTGKIGKNPNKAHADKRKRAAILNKVEPEVAQKAMELAETHAQITGEEITPSVLASAVEVAQEAVSTGGFVDVGDEQVPATEETTIQALQMALDEKGARHNVHANGNGSAVPLQSIHGKLLVSGKGKMLLEFAPELEEKLLEFMRYKEQYPGHDIYVAMWEHPNVKPITRPSRPTAQPSKPAENPDWEKIADGEESPLSELASEPTVDPLPTETVKPAKRTRKPKTAEQKAFEAVVAAEPALQDVLTGITVSDNEPDADALDIF